MKKLIALVLALAMSFSLVACGNQQTVQEDHNSSAGSQEPDNTSNNEEMPEQSTDPVGEVNNEVVEYYLAKANEVAVTDTHVTFYDDGAEKEISIEKNPQNAAVLYSSLTCLWYEAGGVTPITVGGKSAIKLYKQQIGRDITQDSGVNVVAESSSGDAWDVEAIIATKPDLIVTSIGMHGYETIAAPATAAGIPIIGINYDGVQDYLKWFKVFCNLNGKPELWDEIAESTANDIISIVSKVPTEGEAPRAMILQVSSKKLKAYTHNSQQGLMLEELGAVNVIDGDGAGSAAALEISLEDIYSLDPDIIFYSERTDSPIDVLMEMVGDNPVWQNLRAVREDKVYLLELGLFFNKANKRYNESYQTMAEFLYPDIDF